MAFKVLSENQVGKPIGSEVQQETIPAGLAGLTRTITYVADDGSLLGVKETSGTIAAGADAATIQTALIAMTAFATEDIKVTGSGNLFTYSFGGTMANKGFKRMYATYSNGQKVYFETVISGVSLAAQNKIREQETRDALGFSNVDLNGSGIPTPKDIGDPSRYVGFGREFTEALAASSGTRTLTVNGQTTSGLAYNATAATIQAAIEGLSSADPGDIEVILESTGNYRYVYKGKLQGINSVTMTSNGASLLNNKKFTEVITATGGTRTLTVDGQTTSALAFGASAATIQTALEALSTVDPGDVVVTMPVAGTYVYTFVVGRTMSVNAGSLTGGSSTITNVGTSTVALVREGTTPLPTTR